MSQINIKVIVGSLRRDLFNAKLAGAIAKLAPADFTFKNSKSAISPSTIKTMTPTRPSRSND